MRQFRKLVNPQGFREFESRPIRRMQKEILKLSWDDIERYSRELAEKITAVGFVPEFVVGITTGGIIPLFLFPRNSA